DGKRVLLTHQVLYALGRPARGEIVAGNLLANKLTVLSLDDVLKPGADVWRHGRSYDLGDVERGASDPADVAELPDGRVVVALAGVDEVAGCRPRAGVPQCLVTG